MLLILLTLVCFLLILFLFLKWNRVKSYWAERNVPYVNPHPVMGNLTFLQQINPGLWMRQVHESFGAAPYVGVWWFWRPVLVVNDPEIARNILVKDASNFRNRFLSPGTKDPIGSLNLLTVKDPTWTYVRRDISKAFTSSKLKHLYENTIKKKTLELLQRVKNDKSQNIRLGYADYATDIISIIDLGIENNSTLSGDGPLKYVTTQFMYFSLYRGLAWCSIFFYPELADIFRFTFFPKPAISYFRKMFHMIVQQSNANNIERNSLLDVLINLRDNSKEDSIVYTDDLILAQLAVILLGGYDSTSAILTFITYELAYHPKIQEKLYNEIFEAQQLSSDGHFTYEQLSEMTYLNCIIKETLRKYPSMGWFDRRALNDYQVDDKLVIKAGTPVYVNGIGMHYNPNYFPEPHKFDPDRFLPENEKNIQNYTYMPFGLGPRSCIGQQLALLTMRSAVSVIFLNYKVSPLPDQPHVDEVKIDKRGIFYSPGEILKVKFQSRN